MTAAMEIVPGLAEARRERWSEAMTQFLAGAAWGIGVTGQAKDCWRRSWTNLKLRRLLARRLGLPDAAGHLCDRPGAAAFAGVARAELAGDAWQELPLYDVKCGRLVVTIPVLTYAEARPGATVLAAIDLLAVDPESAAVAALTAHHDGVIGHAERLAAEDPVRVYPSPLAWLKAGGSTCPALAPAAVCILDEYTPSTEDLLLHVPLACGDEDHAAELYAMQERARRRALDRARRSVGAGGKLFVQKAGR